MQRNELNGCVTNEIRELLREGAGIWIKANYPYSTKASIAAAINPMPMMSQSEVE